MIFFFMFFKSMNEAIRKNDMNENMYLSCICVGIIKKLNAVNEQAKTSLFFDFEFM